MTKHVILLSYLLLASLTISAIALVFPPIKAEPTTWTLDDDIPAVFSTIQDVVAVANVDSAPVEYELSIAVIGSGSISPDVGSHTYKNGTEVAVTAIDSYSHYGWLFEYWVLDGSTVIGKKNHNPLYLIMDQNHELKAVFLQAPNTYPTPEPTPSPSPTSEPTAIPTPTPSPEIPELPGFFLPLFMIATLLTAFFYCEKHKS